MTGPSTSPEAMGAPWPDVPECYGHRRPGEPSTCPQCEGSHRHRWVTWHRAPQVGEGTSLVGSSSGPGLPVRCAVCGGRKCDDRMCAERRHHAGPHLGYDETVREIGASS